MELTPVDSSLVAAHGYDEDTNTLHIQFKKGGTYTYANVPPEKYAALTSAESFGSHFLKNINGVHDHTKLPDTPGR